MEYKGKLYGKVGKIYFEIGKTSDDYDKLVQQTEAKDREIAELR